MSEGDWDAASTTPPHEGDPTPDIAGRSLLRLIEASAWARVSEVLRLDSVSSAERALAELLQQPGRYGMVAVHYAMLHSMPVDQLKLLVAAHPAGCRARDDRGQCALHLAIKHRASLECVRVLIAAYPEACRDADQHGNLPLHLAAQFRAPVGVVNAVLRENPEAAARKDMYGNLPLHLAAQFRAPAEVVDAVLRANPDAAAVRNVLCYHEHHELYHSGLSEEKFYIGKRWRKRADVMAHQMFDSLAEERSDRLVYEQLKYFKQRVDGTHELWNSTFRVEFDKAVEKFSDRRKPPSFDRTGFCKYVQSLEKVAEAFKKLIREPHEQAVRTASARLSTSCQMDISDEEYGRLAPEEQLYFEVVSPGNLPIHLALEDDLALDSFISRTALVDDPGRERGPLESDTLRKLIEPYPANLGSTQPLLEPYRSLHNDDLPNLQRRDGELPLHMIMYLGKVPADAVGLLICPEACVNQANTDKHTPLHIAIQMADVPVEILKRLIIDFDTSKPGSAQNGAHSLGAPLSQLLKQARQRQLDPRQIDEAIDSSDAAGQLERLLRREAAQASVARVLLARDQRGSMPLHVAVGCRRIISNSSPHDSMMEVGRVALVQTLLEKEAGMAPSERPVQQKDFEEVLPLQIALSTMPSWNTVGDIRTDASLSLTELQEAEQVIECLLEAYPHCRRVRLANDNVLPVNFALGALNAIPPENTECKVVAERIVQLLMVPLSLAVAEARDNNSNSIELVKRIVWSATVAKINTLKSGQLQEILRSLDMDTKGDSADLRKRLLQAVASSGETASIISRHPHVNMAQSHERNCRGEPPLFTALAEGSYMDLEKEKLTVVKILPGSSWGKAPIKFQVKPAKTEWPYVAQITKEYRPSEEVGAILEVGAKLLAINDVLVDGMAFDEAKPLLQQRPVRIKFACPRYEGKIVWEAVYELLQHDPQACLNRGNTDETFYSRRGLEPSYPLRIATKQAARISALSKNDTFISNRFLRRALDIMTDLYEQVGDEMKAIVDTALEEVSVSRTAIGQVSEVSKWAKEHGTILERYRVETTVHRSATCKVCFALDVVKNQRVALKFMKDPDLFKIEVHARVLNDMQPLDPEVVIEVIGWHTPNPNDEEFLDGDVKDDLTRTTRGRNGAYMQVPDSTTRGKKAEETFNRYTEGFVYKYLLVMKCGERSLHDKCAKGRIAGYDINYVRCALVSIANCIKQLHKDAGLCHGDIKQRNLILEQDDDHHPKLVLCDMDASAKMGEQIGRKTSSAYCPPELAKRRFKRSGDEATVVAQASFDIWSFGVVIYELCAGRTLFSQDTANDELVEVGDRSRLCVWHTITDDELLPVLAKADPQRCVGNLDRTREDCKNLIRWCLKGTPAERPQTIDDILNHRFLAPGAEKPDDVPMKYHAFMSHAQKDASGTVAATFLAYKQLGVHNWLDMRQENLTLEGMQKGVDDSDVFLLVLTRHVLTSWYCQQEMKRAIAKRKKIQLLLEEESRFFPFDEADWKEQQKQQEIGAEASAERMCWHIDGTKKAVPADICEMVDKHLDEAITYRRRDFEAESMMRELCSRNGLHLPDNVADDVTTNYAGMGGTELRIFCIYNFDSAGEFIDGECGLKRAMLDCTPDKSVIFTDSSELQSVDKVVLVLTEGVLTPPTLHYLEELLAQDEEQKRHSDDHGEKIDRLVCIYSETHGWEFDGKEIKDAPRAVRSAVENHEALAFRPRSDGRSRHEFLTMLAQLVARLGLPYVPPDANL